jgi:hypothetical protein
MNVQEPDPDAYMSAYLFVRIRHVAHEQRRLLSSSCQLARLNTG